MSVRLDRFPSFIIINPISIKHENKTPKVQKDGKDLPGKSKAYQMTIMRTNGQVKPKNVPGPRQSVQ